MTFLQRLRATRLPAQYAVCITTVLVVALGCYATTDLIGHRVTALVLLLIVALLAMLFRIGPVMAAAALSALIWNFFFIPPTFTFHIGSTEDALMFMMYFVVASVNTVLTLKIRQIERKAREEEEKERSIALYHTLFNSLSHELRTPIATILGAVDALQGDPGRLSAEQRTDLLAEIDTASERLDRQVGDLLSMSRLESGMVQPKPDWCDVNELVGALVHSLEGGGHRFVFRPDAALPLFKLDGGMLREVVRNLLHNAAQHTPTGTLVEISAAHRAGACVVVVADNGPGIPHEAVPQVFDKFHRLPKARPGGSGLGLSIVKGFVEAQGGRVDLRMAEPSGAVFTVSIPAEVSFISNLKNE